MQEIENIKELDIERLQSNVIRRNVIIQNLRKLKGEMERVKEDELDDLVVDGNHLGSDSFIRRKFLDIIDDMESIINTMINGDWSLSVESTKEREKQFPCWECGEVGCTKH